MFEYKTTGKTINEAVENGLNALKLERKDVEIKVQKNAKNFQDAVVVLCVPDYVVKNCEHIEKIKSLQLLENKIADAENLLKKNKAEKNNILESLSAQILQDGNKELNKEQVISLTKNFVDGIVSSFGSENFESVVECEGNYAKINITGKHLQKLIGFKGKTLASLQFLANVFASKFGRFELNVHIDINGYKAEKEKKVAILANQSAKQVQETQNEIALPPMNAFERRVVHNEVAKFLDLVTESVGDEPDRYVVIKLSKK